MRTWRPIIQIVLIGVWPQLGCHQLPTDPSVKDVRPIQPQSGEAMKKEAAMRVDPTPMAQAKALADAGKIAEAAALYEKIRTTDNSQALNATRKLAALYLRHNELDRAEQEYQSLVQYQPGDADILCALGDISSRRGHFGTAEKRYLDALAKQPDHKNALAGLGMAVAQRGAYEESVEIFQRVHGSEAEARCEVAFVMKLNGKTADAARAYQAALSKDPGNVRARNELAQMYQADPSLGVRLTTPFRPEKSAKRGVVELEPNAPLLASEGTNRLMLQRPALPPAPEFDLDEGNGRDWQASGQKK